jgi:hypothetical protein
VTSQRPLPSQVTPRWRILLAAWCKRIASPSLWISASCLIALSAQAASLPEYKVKAAFLYKFTKFIEWPEEAFEDSESPFTLCVIGKDPFGTALDPLKERTAQGRTILILKTSYWEKLTTPCHMMFVAESERKRVDSIVAAFRLHPSLTVSDIKNFARQGGIMNFIKKNKKIRFVINVRAGKKAGLKISAQLLELATVVTDEY